MNHRLLDTTNQKLSRNKYYSSFIALLYCIYKPTQVVTFSITSLVEFRFFDSANWLSPFNNEGCTDTNHPISDEFTYISMKNGLIHI